MQSPSAGGRGRKRLPASDPLRKEMSLFHSPLPSECPAPSWKCWFSLKTQSMSLEKSFIFSRETVQIFGSMFVSSFSSVSAAVKRSSMSLFLCTFVFALFWRTQLRSTLPKTVCIIFRVCYLEIVAHLSHGSVSPCFSAAFSTVQASFPFRSRHYEKVQ